MRAHQRRRHVLDRDRHRLRRGHSLARLPVVGLGSVCRRQAMGVAAQIVYSLRDLRLHGFGFKTGGLTRVGDLLATLPAAS